MSNSNSSNSSNSNPHHHTYKKFGIEICIEYQKQQQQQQERTVSINSKGYKLSIHPFFFKNKLSIQLPSTLTPGSNSPKSSTANADQQKYISSYVDDAGIAKPLNQSIFDIFSRSKFLSTLVHENLVEFIAAEPSKKHHDQILLVSEDYSNSLLKVLQRQAKTSISIPSNTISSYAYQILKALTYLHSNNLTHRNLSIENIKFNEKNEIKLTNYGLYFLSDEGENVSFPIGNLLYLSPESILKESKGSSNPKADVWALGCILLHICLGYCIWDDNDPNIVTNRILYLFGFNNTCQTFNTETLEFQEIDPPEHEFADSQYSRANIDSFLLSIKSKIQNDNLFEIISHCLTPNPLDRPSSSTLLDHPHFDQFKLNDAYKPDWIVKPSVIKSMDLPDNLTDIVYEKETRNIVKDYDVFSGLEVYYLWKLMGGNIEKELISKGFAKPSPSVHKLPLFVPVKSSLIQSGTSNTQPIIKSNNSILYNNEVCIVDIDNLFVKFKSAFKSNDILKSLEDYQAGYLLNQSKKDGNATYKASSLKNNVEYQMVLIKEFHRLLYEYQFGDPTLSQPKIFRLAKSFIPPVLRGDLWSAILGVNDKEAAQLYYSINLDQKGPNDKQFELDIPRCHQYHPLLSSKQGHSQLFRILKAWSLLNIEKGCYWQGLDNVASPFLVHHFYNESKAFASVKAFVDKYLKILYVPNNMASLSEIMLTYQQLLSYHDPELSTHLLNIQLEPDLYAIPWFITVFAHLLSLDKIDILWDTILLCPSSLPYFIAVSMISQFKSHILKMNFEDGIKIISMIPSVDVEKCIQDALFKFNNTPLSTTVNKYISNADGDLWWMQEKPMDARKKELFPRIGIHDLINSNNSNNTDNNGQPLPVKIIDIRSPSFYQQCHYPNSINMNPKGSKTPTQMESIRGHPIVVIAPPSDIEGIDFCNQLVKWKLPYVSLLNGGMDALQHGASTLLIYKNQDDSTKQ
ncbi:hypothetical protein CYY_004945 [Polysphondylium violaceum]|uniref:RabGAP/TBC domain-containing protein n=1 Tax=Polysphondylium violaceum TaxID=133409 RepID=A0A8J4PSJ5_9MYCE|nr:hypothetical protein CYY_004945 [Polysphondylium violaceum]